MLIQNKRAFSRGLMLMSSFLVVFVMFFMPIFPSQTGGEKTNGLVFADNLFNTLSKGSAYFFDETATNKESVEYRILNVKDSQIEVTVPFKDTAMMESAQKLVLAAGLESEVTDNGLFLKGALDSLLTAMITDSLSMYKNQAEEVSQRHEGEDGKGVMKAWWTLGTSMIKPLQRIGQVKEASAVSVVVGKAIEPSYNFYGIRPLKVQDNVPLVAGFLIFYVIYTMWYGFAIFELFEGIGLTMKKAAHKQEV